ASVPADEVENFKKMDKKEERAKFFEKWALDRAKFRAVNGVYVLICKEPTYLYVEVTPKARTVFNKETRDKIREVLLTEFKDKRFDAGLLGAVKVVHDRLEKVPVKPPEK